MISDKLLCMKEVSTLLGVTPQTLRKDRLARFGVELIRALLHSFGTELVVVNQVESDYKPKIMDDMMAIIVHFSSRLYGKRRGKRKSTQIKQILQHPEN